MKARAIRSKGKRKGFSLVEVLVALTMLSIILMSLARVTFQMAASSRTNDIVAKRNAALIEEANKYSAMPFVSLASSPAADRTYGDFKFQRTVTVTPRTGYSGQSTVKILIVPYIANVLTTAKRDSVILYRTNPPGSPLCTTC
jgi:prepilin-type N-terminal cleavage/methylation domain-containing protein